MSTITVRMLPQLPTAAQWPEPPPGDEVLPVQTAAWAHARAALLPPQVSTHWLAAEDADGIAALAPLLRQGRWLREPPAMFEPSDFAWRTPAALDALAMALARQPLPLQLDRVPAASPTVAALRRAYAGRGVVRALPAMPTPLITLDGRWSDPDAALGARRRADFRRYERRARRHGELRFELHAPVDAATLDPVLEAALVVESRSWKAWARTALTSDPVQGEFFGQFTRDAASAGVLRIALLHIGERPAAMQIATQWRSRFWLFKIAHDRDFDDCSPGQLLMHHTLTHAARSGAQAYELMGVMSDWTQLWTQQTRPYLRLQAFPYSAAAALVLARRLARTGIDRLRGRRS